MLLFFYFRCRSKKRADVEMGSFGGHALPGSFFIIFSVWWTWRIFSRFYNCRRNNTRFTATAIYNCPFLPGRLKEWPMEGVVKIFFVFVGFSLEIYTGFGSNGRFVNMSNGQHATMFFYFGFTGIVDILLYFKAPLPKDMDYASMLLALMAEGLLFKFHLHGRTDLDVLVHTLLLYGIAANMVAVMVEMRYRHNVLSPLSRAYFLLLQGTWFWQVGWILYPPFDSSARWDEEDHEQMMIATMMFTWHAIADVLFMLVIGAAVALLHKRFSPFRKEDNMAMKRLINSSEDGTIRVALNDDSESELDLETPVVQ